MFKTAATKIAHNSTIPALGVSQDLRPLQDLITAEKAVLVSLQKLSVDYSKASEALRTWGLSEGDDLGNILSAATSILSHFSSALLQYAKHGQSMRERLKTIRTREECLDDLKRRRRNVHRKAEDADKKLNKLAPDHRNYALQKGVLDHIREDIRTMDSNIMSEEAALSDFKRTATKLWLGLKFGALLECCEKGAIAGEYGKLIIAEISEETTQPGMPRSLYNAYDKIEDLVAQAHQCVDSVTLSTVPSAGFPDRRQCDHGSSDSQPAAFYISPKTGYGQPSNNGLPLSPGEPQAPSTSTTLQDDNVSYLQAIRPFRGSGYLPENPDSSFAPSLGNQPYAPPYQSQGLFSQTMPSQSQQPRVNEGEGALDDFGVNIHSNGPMNRSDTSGGRFVTFPVKTRPLSSSGGYLLQDPPLLGGRQIMGDSSLSESIAEALQENENPSSGTLSPWATHPINGDSGSSLTSNGKTRAGEDSYNQQTIPWGGRPDNNPPPFESTYSASVTAPLQFPVDKKHRLSDQFSSLQPPAPGNPTGPRRLSQSSENQETLLAYMTEGSASRESSPIAVSLVPPITPTTTTAPVEYEEDSRHARFGSVTEVDGIEQHVSLEKEQTGNNSNTPKQGKPTTWNVTNSDDSPQQVKPTSSRVPPPTSLTEEDEQALNAAAAREITLELGALKNNSQNPLLPQVDQRSPSDTTPDVDGVRTMTAPTFNNPPPHPFARLNPPGAYAPYATPQPYQSPASTAQPFQQQNPDMRNNLPPRFQALNSNNIPAESQVPPRFQGPSPIVVNSLPPRFQTNYTPQISAPGGVNTSDQERGDGISPIIPRSPASTTSPFTKPNTPPISNNPFLQFQSPGSTPPLNVNASMRTINAAAFKRPVQRNPVSTDSDAMAGKKTLPSSPYPTRDAGNDASVLTVQGSEVSGTGTADNYITANENNTVPSSEPEGQGRI